MYNFRLCILLCYSRGLRLCASFSVQFSVFGLGRFFSVQTSFQVTSSHGTVILCTVCHVRTVLASTFVLHQSGSSTQIKYFSPGLHINDVGADFFVATVVPVNVFTHRSRLHHPFKTIVVHNIDLNSTTRFSARLVRNPTAANICRVHAGRRSVRILGYGNPWLTRHCRFFWSVRRVHGIPHGTVPCA